MRDLVRRLLRRAPDRPRPSGLPAGPPPDPWARAWTGPTKEEAAEIFRREADERRARRTTLLVVDGGIWLPGPYEGPRR